MSRTIRSTGRTNYYGTGDPIVATVRSGDTFTLECTSFSEGFTLEAIGGLRLERAIAPVTGPLWIDGAHAGDTLRVEILDLEITRDFGCILLIPGRGVFADQVTEFTVRGVRLDRTH